MALAICTVKCEICNAQYVKINIDRETVATMAAAYATEALIESFYNEQAGKILEKYQSAEVAAAAIFASKYLDRKALTTLGIWGDGTQNYYYRRIYVLVASKIMPKIWTVAGLMLKSPMTAVYWGSYLMKICQETKNLCYQFESVVTNSSLSFRGITFLEMDPRVSALLDITKLGGVDWKAMLDGIASLPQSFTKDDLKADLDNLYALGASIAGNAGDNLISAVYDQSTFHDLFNGKVSNIIDILDHYEALYMSLDRSIGNTLLGIVGAPTNVGAMFTVGNYDINQWVTNYVDKDESSYYTQTWRVYWRDHGSEVLCDYTPPTDQKSILSGGEWKRYRTSNTSYYPTDEQRETILSNSESYAGWSRDKVNSLNASGDGCVYTFEKELQSYTYRSGLTYRIRAFAYSIKVTKSWDIKEYVDEYVFDSRTMSYDIFMRTLAQRVAELNEQNDGKTYGYEGDARNYYTVADAEKMAGCETAIISVTCHDNAELMSGSTQYKCSGCSSSVNDHTRQCSMSTTVTNDNLDISKLQQSLTEAQAKVDALKTEIAALSDRNTELLKLIGKATVEEAVPLRQEYNSNKDRIEQLQSELSQWQSTVASLQAAIAEAQEGEAVQTDDYYRIPAIMAEVQTAFAIAWQDSGAWEGNTFVRYGKAQNISGALRFEATISIARKPKYFMGIKIHRAIVQIAWKVTGEFSDSQVVDIIQLDPKASDESKAQLVNSRISQVLQDYPGCDVTTEYVKTDPTEDNAGADTFHLLWASDRLAVAKEVETRLTAMYASLVSLEKMMHYKYTIIDALKGIAPHINDTYGRRQTLLEESYQRWRENARLQRGGLR